MKPYIDGSAEPGLDGVALRSEYPAARRGTIVLWGLLGSYPFGGMTWQVLHYLVGLRRLGFDVWYVEDSDSLVYSPDAWNRTWDHAANVSYLSHQLKAIGMGDRWIFRPPGVEDSCLGARDLAGLAELYRQADAVFNLCGAQELRDDHRASIHKLVYLETDPVASQVAVAQGNQKKIQELDAYHYLFTYGENLGATDCLVPVKKYCWNPTRPPVYLDWWATSAAPASGAALTTIANWKHAGKDVVWKGEAWHWSKDREFRRFMRLPARSRLPLELAVGGITESEENEMRKWGWRIASSSDITDPAAYREYIRSSLGEFTVAKEQYVRPRSGWFSDRSVCYLAAGRPVIMQDTGFPNIVPTGLGLFSFATEDEAAAAIDAVASDYPRHSAGAREIAREFFDAERVVGAIVETLGLL